MVSCIPSSSSTRPVIEGGRPCPAFFSRPGPVHPELAAVERPAPARRGRFSGHSRGRGPSAVPANRKVKESAVWKLPRSGRRPPHSPPPRRRSRRARPPRYRCPARRKNGLSVYSLWPCWRRCCSSSSGAAAGRKTPSSPVLISPPPPLDRTWWCPSPAPAPSSPSTPTRPPPW